MGETVIYVFAVDKGDFPEAAAGLDQANAQAQTQAVPTVPGFPSVASDRIFSEELLCNSTWWLSPGIVSGLVHPSFFIMTSRLCPLVTRVN